DDPRRWAGAHILAAARHLPVARYRRIRDADSPVRAPRAAVALRRRGRADTTGRDDSLLALQQGARLRASRHPAAGGPAAQLLAVFRGRDAVVLHAWRLRRPGPRDPGARRGPRCRPRPPSAARAPGDRTVRLDP